jgi:putative tryptophan/tyrosine transport system substrate-binding protein
VNRRELLSTLAFSAASVLLPSSARAQGTKLRRVGFISFAPAPLFYEAFRSGMNDLGYIEGKNVLFHARFGAGGTEQLDALAAALVAERPDIIVATGGPAVRSVQKVARDVPVVYSFSGDPVAAGFAQTLAQPGNNMTGISLMSLDLVGKRMELLRESLPHLKSVAILANPDHPGEQLERRVSFDSASALGLEHRYFQAQSPAELQAALQTIANAGADGLVVFPDALTLAHRQQISETALKARLATVSGWAAFAESGFLMTYGPNLNESYRRLATFADKVLKGAQPGKLPIERPSVVEMIVNSRTAQGLGLEIPRQVLLRADRVLS